MGKSVQQLTDKVSLIASESTWIEGAAIQQLIKTSELTGMVSVAGMPDLHPGRGYPIGAAFYSQDRIYPALVGNDIGCGMALWQTQLKLSKTNAEKLASKLTDMESPLDDSWQDTINARKRDKQIEGDAFDRSLGTIGGGNHFAEFQQIDEIYCAVAMAKLGLDKKRLQLLVHFRLSWPGAVDSGRASSTVQSRWFELRHTGNLSDTWRSTITRYAGLSSIVI